MLQTALIGFCATLPMVFSASSGSALIDRLGYQRPCVIAGLLNGLTVLLIPLLFRTISLAFLATAGSGLQRRRWRRCAWMDSVVRLSAGSWCPHYQ